jgi:uncharacterized protein YndB with AHSA1/START domain
MVSHGTFVIERSFPQGPERVFAAFSDPAKKRKWFADSRNMELEKHELDFRAGGSEVTSSRFKEGSPFPGVVMTNHSIYLDIVPGERIVFAYTMTIGENRISASLATIEFTPAESGTKLVFTEQGAYFPGADGLAMREHGWGKLLEALAKEC